MLVVRAVDFFPALDPDRFVAELAQIVEPTNLLCKEAVARALGDAAVQVEIELKAVALKVLPGLVAHSAGQRFQMDEIALPHTAARQLHRPALQRRAQPKELGNLTALQRAEAHAAIGMSLGEAAGHELHQGFANGRPADVELGGQVDLAQPAAGFELIRPDFAEEAFVDTVRQRACLEHAPPTPEKEPEGVLYTEISRYRWELWSATPPLGKQKMQGPRC